MEASKAPPYLTAYRLRVRLSPRFSFKVRCHYWSPTFFTIATMALLNRGRSESRALLEIDGTTDK